MNAPALSARDSALLTVIGDAIRRELATLRAEIDERFRVATGNAEKVGNEIAANVEAMIDKQATALQERIAAALKDEMQDMEGRVGATLREEIADRFELSVPDIERRAILSVQAAIPAPRDGKDGRDGRDGTNGRDGTHGRDGTNGEPGADGVFAPPKAFAGRALRGELIAHKGGLWFAARDCMTAPENGGADWILVCNGIAAITLHETAPGELGVVIEKSDGENIGEVIRVPGNIYRGIWRAGKFKAGDSVTRDGAQWIAEQDTDRRPGEKDSGWRLAVKRGDNGRDGESFEWAGEYVVGRTYKRGQVVRAVAGVFIALRMTDAAPPANGADTDNWSLMISGDGFLE